MRFLVDEDMPRSLAPCIARMGLDAEDVRDIGLHGQPDADVFRAATERDAIIITRDRGFIRQREWPEGFTAGVIVVSLPAHLSSTAINERIGKLLTERLPESLLGTVTILEAYRTLSRVVRRRP